MLRSLAPRTDTGARPAWVLEAASTALGARGGATGPFEHRAHALPKLGIDERKLRADRFPGHVYGFLLKAGFPRSLKCARERWQVRLKRSTARLNDIDSRPPVGFGRLADVSEGGYHGGDINEGRMRVRTHDRNWACRARRARRLGSARGRSLEARRRRRHHGLSETGSGLSQDRPRTLPHVEAMNVSSRGTGAEPRELSVQPAQLGSAGPQARLDLRERLGLPAPPDLLEPLGLPGRKARQAHRVPLAPPGLRAAGTCGVRADFACGADWHGLLSLRRLGGHSRRGDDVGEHRRASVLRERWASAATPALRRPRDQRDRLRPGRCRLRWIRGDRQHRRLGGSARWDRARARERGRRARVRPDRPHRVARCRGVSLAHRRATEWCARRRCADRYGKWSSLGRLVVRG